MTEQRWPGAGGDDDRADLDWLADQFVLGSLSAEDEQAVVDRLADDDALAAAVARSSRLVAALQASRVVAVQPARPPDSTAAPASSMQLSLRGRGQKGDGASDPRPRRLLASACAPLRPAGYT